MKRRLLKCGIAASAIAFVWLAPSAAAGQTPTRTDKTPANAEKGPAPLTPWGEPDLQGIWSRDADIPLQRPTRYRDKEFFARRVAGDDDLTKGEFRNKRWNCSP
jgi:hypothetical protein